MPALLPEIVENKKAEVAARKSATPLDALAGWVEPANFAFLKAMRGDQVKLITEIKPCSPSQGVLAERIDIDSLLSSYNRYASAISVLTDKRYFNGSLDLLSEVSRKSPCPTLCKDFVIDQYQVHEARLAGAEAVLLIVKILDDDALLSLYECVEGLGMVSVIEVQTEAEVERALKLVPPLVMINNRDLSNFEVDLSTTKRLSAMIPQAVTVISASGIENRADIDELRPYCTRFLIGSALMRSGDLEAKLRELAGQ